MPIYSTDLSFSGQRGLAFPNLDHIQILVDCALLLRLLSLMASLEDIVPEYDSCTYWPTTDHSFTQYHCWSQSVLQFAPTSAGGFDGSSIPTPSVDADPNNGCLQPGERTLRCILLQGHGPGRKSSYTSMSWNC